MDISSAIYADNLIDCHVYIGPVNGSCKLSNCHNSSFSIATHQFRTKDCSDILVHLYSVSDPHIEKSKRITFAPYNFAYPQQTVHFQKVRFDFTQNRWDKVFDHNPGKNHFDFLEPSKFSTVQYTNSEHQLPENPVVLSRPYNDITGSIIEGNPSWNNKQSAVNDHHIPENCYERQTLEQVAPPFQSECEYNLFSYFYQVSTANDRSNGHTFSQIPQRRIESNQAVRPDSKVSKQRIGIYQAREYEIDSPLDIL